MSIEIHDTNIGKSRDLVYGMWKYSVLSTQGFLREHYLKNMGSYIIIYIYLYTQGIRKYDRHWWKKKLSTLNMTSFFTVVLLRHIFFDKIWIKRRINKNIRKQINKFLITNISRCSHFFSVAWDQWLVYSSVNNAIFAFHPFGTFSVDV